MARMHPLLRALSRFLRPAAIATISGLLALSATGALGQSASNIITFDAPGSGTGYGRGTFPEGMNSKGVIVGWVLESNNQTSGFLRRADGTMTIIRVPGAKNTTVYGINDSGTIVGTSDSQTFFTTGFIRTADGKFTYFRPLGTQFWENMKIDNLGNVAGTIISTFDLFACYIRTADGTITTFNPPGGFECEFNDIVAGTVSGTYGGLAGFFAAFLRHPDGTFTAFQVGYLTGGTVVNSADTAVGSFVLSQSDSVWHGFSRAVNGGITYFDVAGATRLAVVDINSAGTVAGNFSNSADGSNDIRGFQRAPDGSVEVFAAPGAGTGFFQGTFPAKLNDAGKITGSVVDTNNVYHGFLLTPQ